MKLYSNKNDEAGVLVGENEILFIKKAAEVLGELQAMPTCVADLIRADDSHINRLETFVKKLSSDHDLKKKFKEKKALIPLADVELAAPISGPRLMVAVGLNYTDHLEEMDTPPPENPYVFIKSYSSIIGTDESIVFPKDHENMVDWEAELLVVIGKPCYQVAPENALDYVFGYMASNDVSARDWVQSTFDSKTQMEAINNWAVNLLGKQFPTFCPIGPCLVTKSEIPDPLKLNIFCRVNGKVMQSSNTSKMLCPVEKVISYVSKFYALQPGDAILTGTMAGVGYGRNPKVFLQKGDVVEVEIEKIGVLRNTVSV